MTLGSMKALVHAGFEYDGIQGIHRLSQICSRFGTLLPTPVISLPLLIFLPRSATPCPHLLHRGDSVLSPLTSAGSQGGRSGERGELNLSWEATMMIPSAFRASVL